MRRCRLIFLVLGRAGVTLYFGLCSCGNIQSILLRTAHSWVSYFFFFFLKRLLSTFSSSTAWCEHHSASIPLEFKWLENRCCFNKRSGSSELSGLGVLCCCCSLSFRSSLSIWRRFITQAFFIGRSNFTNQTKLRILPRVMES